MGDILGQHYLADFVRPDQHDVDRFTQECKRHQRLDGAAIATLGPLPVEVGQMLESSKAGVLDAPLQAALVAPIFLPLHRVRDSVDVGHVLPVRE